MVKETDELTALRGRVAELEAKLAEREIYAQFFERSQVMFCVADQTGRFTRLNHAWERVLGWSLEVLYTDGFIHLIHPEDFTVTAAALEELKHGKPAIAFENRYRHKDGTYRHLRWFATPTDAQGFQHGVAQDITELRIAEQRARVYEDTILSSATGMFVCHVEQPGDPNSLVLVMANEASERFTQVPLRAEVGRRFVDIFTNIAATTLPRAYMDVALSGGALDLGEVVYGDDRVAQGYFSVKAYGLPGSRVCVNFENITERKKAEEARLNNARQQEIIRVQAAALAELSTPLIPVSDDIVVMPLIGAIDSRRAEQVLETLLAGVASRRAATAIVDITGVSGVDTRTADALLRAARAVRLLGARVMLTGIRPEIARMFVELGVDLSAVSTHGSLQAGIAAAFAARGA